MMKTWLVPMCPQSCLSPSLTSQLSDSCTFALTPWSMKGDYDGHEALMMIEIDIFTQVRVLDSKCTYFADMIWYYVVISIYLPKPGLNMAVPPGVAQRVFSFWREMWSVHVSRKDKSHGILILIYLLMKCREIRNSDLATLSLIKYLALAKLLFTSSLCLSVPRWVLLSFTDDKETVKWLSSSVTDASSSILGPSFKEYSPPMFRVTRLSKISHSICISCSAQVQCWCALSLCHLGSETSRSSSGL